MYYKYFKNSNSSITIVLLHGWGVNSLYMESIKDLLIDDYSILLVDLPGHGKSILQEEYTLDKYVDELFYIVTKEECQEQIETARTVIDEIEKYIDKNK